MAQVMPFNSHAFLRELRRICTAYQQPPRPSQRSSSNSHIPNNDLFLRIIAAATMDPGHDFVEEVIQHAADGLRSVLNRDGQVPHTTDEALTNALRQCFLEKMGLDLEDLEAAGRRDLEVIVAALQPRLISRICEGIFNLPPATASVQASGETSTGIRPAASVPANTAPATDNQPTASVLAHTDMSIGTDGAGSQAVVPAANIPSSSQSVRAIVRQHMPERSLRAMAEKVLHSTGRYGIQQPVTTLLSVLEELAARVGRLAVRIVTSPGLVLAFAVVGLGLVVWTYKTDIALSLFRTGFGFVDRSILVPICEHTQNSAVDICYPMCTVAGSLEFPVLACGNQPSWAVITSEAFPALVSEQVMFSKLAASDLVTRFQNLDIRFDNSTNEVLNHSGEIYEKLGSDIAQYSREAESLFQLFTISEDRVNRTFQMGEFEEAKRWYDNILALLPTLAKGKAEESAFNAHTNTVLPRLRQVLATGERIDEKISFLQSQEAQSVSQLRGVEQTLQLLHPQASRIRSILDYLLGVAAGPTQTTGQYVKALTVGYQKVIDASENTARSFKESFSQLQALDSALRHHNTWQGTPQDKPRKVYLTLMRSAFQQAKNALQSWAYEDKRHGDFLFDSLEDRLASLFQVYAWEEMH